MGQGQRRGVAVRGDQPRARAGRAGRRAGVAGHALRRRLRLDQRPERVRRPRAARTPTTASTASSRRATTSADQSFFGIGLGMVAPTILAHATDEVRDAYLAKLYRGDLVGLPALQRARRGLGPGRPADPGRPRRRRVDRQRPEGVDLGRAVQRHRRDHLPHRSRHAQAQGPHRLRGRHARARRRDPPAAPDDRRRLVQRGVLHRRARARHPPARRRQPGLDRGPDHAHERAGLDRRGRWRRQPASAT